MTVELLPGFLVHLDMERSRPHNGRMTRQSDAQAAFAVDIAPRIRSVIDGCRLTPAELARRCGVTRAAVIQWGDTGKISAAQIARLASVTGADVAWLMTGKGGYSPEDRAWLDQVKSLPETDRRRIQALTDGLAFTAEPADSNNSSPHKKSA